MTHFNCAFETCASHSSAFEDYGFVAAAQMDDDAAVASDIARFDRLFVRAKIQDAVDPGAPNGNTVRAPVRANCAYPVIARLVHLTIDPVPSQAWPLVWSGMTP